MGRLEGFEPSPTTLHPLTMRPKNISFIPDTLRLIYLFLITHGCRPSEARALQAGDFNFAEGTDTIQRGFSGNELHDHTKTGNDYAIPIHSSLVKTLKDICINKMPEDFVFTYKKLPWSEYKIYRVWKNAAKSAGYPHVGNYAGVKHAGASEIANNTGDLVGTGKFLGHRGGTKNTERYTKRRDMTRLRKLQFEIVIPITLIAPLQ